MQNIISRILQGNKITGGVSRFFFVFLSFAQNNVQKKTFVRSFIRVVSVGDMIRAAKIIII